MEKETENQKSSSQFLKTDRGKTKSNAIEIHSISLPNGGGAIKGIDEKFSVNTVNGTASFSIPLPFSPSRGASPSMNLNYNSGVGNGVFGLGWTLNLPSIKRKTDQELPRYLDKVDSDTFLFSEAEDLVPEFAKKDDGSFETDAGGKYIVKEIESPDGLFTIRFYRPRIEGLFARIERWSGKISQEIKWRVINKVNVTTLFGWSEVSRISDPQDANKIFKWLPEFVFDDKGNCAHYIYKNENGLGFDGNLLQNRNRIKESQITYTSLYLEKVLYGNKIPYRNLNNAYLNETEYLFQTIFDYGEYDTNAPYAKIRDWDFRTDSFSEYRAGFEIRTTRLCKRVLLFHYFTELPGGSALVKSLDFGFSSASEADFTFLNSVTSCGYIKQPDGTYTSKKLPPIEFEYQKHNWNKAVNSISSDALAQAPAGLDEPLYQFTDLFGEGLSGILTEQGGGLFYKHSLGDGKFEQAKLVSPKPSFAVLGSRLQLMDLDADGSKQLVHINHEPRGYFELSDSEEWQPFRTFENMPNVNMGDSNARMIDLNGDGKQDVLITEDHVFTWYESAGRKGFESVHKTIKPFDEENGPHIVFADAKQTIYLADMSGDGLTDMVRIRNGEVCYRPNLGYGRFGAKVGMDHAPVFDHPDLFNPSHLRLADIDGFGTTDIIYLGKNKFTCWMNLSGNSFSAALFEIDPFPEIHNQAKITVTDLLGNGVACVVWSSPLSGDARAPLKYIDLMDGKKPHIMVSYKNNLGKEVSLEYTPSTRFYIDDKLAGRPWVTKLHFPVHCVSKTEIRDKISGYCFISTYKYHHGYYDHAEREFRCFGMVEQKDTEDFEHWVKGSAGSVVEQELHQEPMLNKSWFHTGVFLNRENILYQFVGEYWYEEMARQGFDVVNHGVPLPDARVIAAPGLDPSIMDHLGAQEWREALRACKGMGLRSETFAQDAPSSGAAPYQIKKQLTPYTVSTHNCVIELLQPKGQNKHIEHMRALYLSNNLKDALPLGQLESLALPFENYQLAYTLTLVDDIFGVMVNEDMMLEGRFTYLEGDGCWWIRSGTTQFVDIGEAVAGAQNRFYLPVSYTDPYGAKTKVKYDDYHLFIEETEDALSNKTRVELYNLRTLSPQRIIDPNNNISEVINIDTAALIPRRLRWIGSGRTVLNNKGNAVKKYEPYFSVTHSFEDLKEQVETGVTPSMYYDAPGRLIKTELPNGTLLRTGFDSWKQSIYDQNDTILESSWYQKRTNRLIDAELIAAGKDPQKEESAAEKAAKHANTPNVQHFDTLGRPVLSVEHNKHLTTGEDEFYLTGVNLDIEGNLRKVVDTRGNTVMQYKYDMLGNNIYQRSMDSGQRWLLINILGNPLRTWDERNHEFQYFYDTLHRPIHSKVIGGDGDTALNHIFDRIFYGEAEDNPELKNLRGQVIRHFDTGGLVETPEKVAGNKLFDNLIEWHHLASGA